MMNSEMNTQNMNEHVVDDIHSIIRQAVYGFDGFNRYLSRDLLIRHINALISYVKIQLDENRIENLNRLYRLQYPCLENYIDDIEIVTPTTIQDIYIPPFFYAPNIFPLPYSHENSNEESDNNATNATGTNTARNVPDYIKWWINSTDGDMAILGPNGTTVPKEFIMNLNYNYSVTRITGEIVNKIFDIETPATHNFAEMQAPCSVFRNMQTKDIVHFMTCNFQATEKEIWDAIEYYHNFNNFNLTM